MNFRKPAAVLLSLFIIFAVLMIVIAIFAPLFGISLAEDYYYDYDLNEMYVICQPNDYIKVRSGPSRKSQDEGYLLPGDSVWVSSKKKHGYIYSPAMTNESGEGWIYSGYLVEDKPENLGGEYYRINSIGRVACRKCIGGKRRCWLYNGDRVRVWYMSAEWCVTNRGFIMTRYLEEDP